MITTELKKRILKEVQRRRPLFEGSDAKYAVSLGINNAQYSRVKNGELERVLSDASWIGMARRLEVNLSDAPEWKTAETPVFRYIMKQLEVCRTGGLSLMLCDLSDIGKTYTARHYAKTHKNVVYIDCSQVKSKQKLIRQIAKSFGVGSSGRYADVYGDLVFYLKTLPAPLIVLDEAGDLQYDAFLEIKALWNATEGACAYYMMGADGLKEKIRRAIDNKKVGYTELFSRFGKKYGKVIPVSSEEKAKMLQVTAAMIIRANAPDADVNRVVKGSLGEDNTPSLRRIRTELMKLN
jgi:hypothetical protein